MTKLLAIEFDIRPIRPCGLDPSRRFLRRGVVCRFENVMKKEARRQSLLLRSGREGDSGTYAVRASDGATAIAGTAKHVHRFDHIEVCGSMSGRPAHGLMGRPGHSARV
ncbi:hypothetical protein [Methylobacterium sp. ID0610]|uniref:hypothetical protein n=1 Tax=Methylobacterium carpenticola TaxID=3344827 RepID=UPI0036A4979E